MRGSRKLLMHMGGLLLALMLTTASQASSLPAPPPPPDAMTVDIRPWSEVEAVRNRVETGHGLRFDGGYRGQLLLADDGRLVQLQRDFEQAGAARQAMLGSYERDGNWLTLKTAGASIDLSALDAEERQMYEEAMKAYRAAKALQEAADGAEAIAEAVPAFELPPERYLLVSLADGDLLVEDGEMLKWAIQRWAPGEPLELHATWRNGKLATTAEDGWREVEIADPLNAGLPTELSRLLSREPVQAQLVDLLDSEESLVWKAHQSKVRVKLDRGEHQGVYPDMQLLGLPPDDDLRLTVIESTSDEAIAELEISRFAPGDPVRLPTPGARLTSRLPKSMSCHFNTGLPVSAKITAISTAADELVYDDDGFAFITLTLDAGSSAGFLFDEDLGVADYIGGEGRVRAMDRNSTTVLWRVQRYGESHVPELPKVGDEVGTSAWRSERWEAKFAEENLDKALMAD